MEQSGRYDLILTAMPEPSSGRSNRFYTREFFELCRQHLQPAGVVGLRLAASENVWTPARRARAASIARALSEAFNGEVTILPGQAAYILLASADSLDRDPDSLAGRLAVDGELLLVSPAYVRYLYTSDRFREAQDLLAATDVPLNRDDRPACYAYTQVIWLSRFLPDLMWRDTFANQGRLLIGWVLVGLVAGGILIRLVRHRDPAFRIVLAGVAGLTGIVLEGIVLLHYQVQRGVLYRDLGVLLTGFMLGLGLGGAVLARVREPGRSTGIVILVGLTVLTGFAVWVTASGLAPGLPVALILMLAAGFVTAALLGFASRFRRPPEAPLVGPLFAADLFGGCLGSVGATLLLIPVLGLPGAAAVLMAPILLAALLVF
jgi:spermidine synthase